MTDDIMLKILDNQIAGASRMGSMEASMASIISGIETNRSINKEAHGKIDTKMNSLEAQVAHLHLCVENRVGRLERNWKLLVTAASTIGAFVATGVGIFKDKIAGWFA